MNILKSVLIALILLIGYSSLSAQELKVISYNIRNDYHKRGPDAWSLRKHDMVELLNAENPQIFGVQEALSNQVAYLDSALTAYSYVGVGRDDGKEEGEYCAIYYKTSQFSVLSQNTFWLSNTPNQASMGWDAACVRICTYALLEHKQSKKKIWALNAHFDHVGSKAREESAKMISQFISDKNKNNDPVLIMGDLNAEEDAKSIKILSKDFDDAKTIAKTNLGGPIGTFNGFNPEPINKRIDYFFLSHIAVNSYAHIEPKTSEGRHVSDHLPVIIEIDLDTNNFNKR